MEKRDKEMPYEVIIQERNKVDLYGNVVYYIYWFDKYGNDITNEWKFWSKGPKKKYDRVNRYLTDSWLKEYCGNNNGLTDEECEEIQRFLEAAEGYPVDVDLETQGFYRCNDAGTLPGECADFIFHKCND